ncbi:MAG: hypothetical protein SVU32_07040 [Candidatus Nanohaloarchaea archaeon]|nr:hypothetical protein [Candidatus Nanohaloarchaea archaeon]
METSNGLHIDPRGTVTAEAEDGGEEREFRWGKIDDPEAGEFQDTLGIEQGEWVENGSDDEGRYFVYEVDGTRYRFYKDDLNQG